MPIKVEVRKIGTCTKLVVSKIQERPLRLNPLLSEDERQELDAISITAKDGHPVEQQHCQMCYEKNSPCWIPHRTRYYQY